LITGRLGDVRLCVDDEACQVGAGRSGIQGRPVMASRSTVIMLRPCLAAVET